MDKYELIFEALQERVEIGELTLEEAEVLNDAAYNRYVVEARAIQRYIKDHPTGKIAARYSDEIDRLNNGRTAAQLKSKKDGMSELASYFRNKAADEQYIRPAKDSKKRVYGGKKEQEPSDLYYLMRSRLGNDIPKKRLLEWRLKDKEDNGKMSERDKATFNRVKNS